MQEKEKAPEQVGGGKLREETESEEAYARYTSSFSKAYAKRIQELKEAGDPWALRKLFFSWGWSLDVDIILALTMLVAVASPLLLALIFAFFGD